MKIFEQKHEDINEKTSNIKLYENCNQLMLDRFIQIIVEGDLRLLIMVQIFRLILKIYLIFL